MYKGDRTLTHNALRDTANWFAKTASLNPVEETPRLLPPRPDSASIRERGAARGRRLADILVPRCIECGPAAWEFAVTSGLGADELHA